VLLASDIDIQDVTDKSTYDAEARTESAGTYDKHWDRAVERSAQKPAQKPQNEHPDEEDFSFERPPRARGITEAVTTSTQKPSSGNLSDYKLAKPPGSGRHRNSSASGSHGAVRAGKPGAVSSGEIHDFLSSGTPAVDAPAKSAPHVSHAKDGADSSSDSD